ncbi:hypothetical protein JCM10207_009178 [Rhodosporidiobolus poonsookiae]
MASSRTPDRASGGLSYRLTVACEFEADLSDNTLQKALPLEQVALAAGHGTVELTILIANLSKVVTMGKECYGDIFNSPDNRQYRVVLTLECAYPDSHGVIEATRLRGTYLGDSNFQPLPHNFRLFFPKLGNNGASLWVNADLLAKACPYFADLTASGFSEAAPWRNKRARTNASPPVASKPAEDETDFDDSDDETDEFRCTECAPIAEEAPDDLSYREITITQTAFSTYHALLVFLQTGYLCLAPLTSACQPCTADAPGPRRKFLSQHRRKNPSLPLPVSPKSLYRLIDLLRLPETTGLAARCLEVISSSLTLEGAALELFGDTAIAVEPIRKVVLGFVVANWDKVSETASWKEWSGKVKAGELPAAAGVAMELAEALREYVGKKG